MGVKRAVGATLIAASMVIAVGACRGDSEGSSDGTPTSAAATAATPPPTIPRPFARNVTFALRTWKARVESATLEGDQVRVVVRMQSYRHKPTTALAQAGAFTVRDGVDGKDVQALSIEGGEEPVDEGEFRTLTLRFPLPGPLDRAYLSVNGDVLKGESATVPLFADVVPQD